MAGVVGSPTSLLPEKLSDLDLNRHSFRFFDLPFELRSKILGYILTTESVIDLDPNNYRTAHRRLSLLLVSHAFHAETSHVFYSSNTFRIFPTHGRFFGHKTKPLLSRFSNRDQSSLVSLELRLGPGWTCPPQSWRVNDRLGLERMTAVRQLKVFVECDPSHDIFKGFRVGKDFYTDFSTNLLKEIIRRLPAVDRVEFNGWPSVMQEGPLMRKLVKVAIEGGKRVVEWSAPKALQDLPRVYVCLEKLEWALA